MAPVNAGSRGVAWKGLDNQGPTPSFTDLSDYDQHQINRLAQGSIGSLGTDNPLSGLFAGDNMQQQAQEFIAGAAPAAGAIPGAPSSGSTTGTETSPPPDATGGGAIPPINVPGMTPTSGGSSLALQGLAGAGPDSGTSSMMLTMPQPVAPMQSIKTPSSYRQGVGQRFPPQLSAVLAGLRTIY